MPRPIFKKIKFYNVEHLVKDYPDAQYYIAIGERSNGKTYSALDYAQRRYFETGEQFAYIRRFGEDIRPKNIINLFSAITENNGITIASKGMYTGVAYSRGRFFPLSYDADKDEKVTADEPMGYAFDLNSMEHYKSVSFPKITTIIFDEFLSRQGYLNNEFILFMNMVSTIVRHRNNVKIFMLGNTVTQYCPYFAEMGLKHIKDQSPGTIDLYKYSDTDLQVVVEYCSPTSKRGGKSSDTYFAFDNPQLQMITGGAWEFSVYPHLLEGYRPKDIAFTCFMQFEGELLTLDLVFTETRNFLYIHRKTTPLKHPESDIVYVTESDGQWNYKIGFRSRDSLTVRIVQFLKEGKTFYSDNEVGEIVRNFMLWDSEQSLTRK